MPPLATVDAGALLVYWLNNAILCQSGSTPRCYTDERAYGPAASIWRDKYRTTRKPMSLAGLVMTPPRLAEHAPSSELLIKIWLKLTNIFQGTRVTSADACQR